MKQALLLYQQTCSADQGAQAGLVVLVLVLLASVLVLVSLVVGSVLAVLLNLGTVKFDSLLADQFDQLQACFMLCRLTLIVMYL